MADKKHIPMPPNAPKIFNSAAPCDMLHGPCCCGAWHLVDDWLTGFRLQQIEDQAYAAGLNPVDVYMQWERVIASLEKRIPQTELAELADLSGFYRTPIDEDRLKALADSKACCKSEGCGWTDDTTYECHCEEQEPEPEKEWWEPPYHNLAKAHIEEQKPEKEWWEPRLNSARIYTPESYTAGPGPSVDAYSRLAEAYIARGEEIERLKDEIADRDESARIALAGGHPDEKHCACVPYLHQEIERLKKIEAADLPGRVLEMCKARGWRLDWCARGAYLHLEASELIEALRGKRGEPSHEAADVLIVLMSITEANGIAWGDVLRIADERVTELILNLKPYPGEHRGEDDE